MTNQLMAKPSQNPSLASKNRDNELKNKMRTYSAPQKVKYLHLEAEIEVLLQQLQTLKQQKQSSCSEEN